MALTRRAQKTQIYTHNRQNQILPGVSLPISSAGPLGSASLSLGPWVNHLGAHNHLRGGEDSRPSLSWALFPGSTTLSTCTLALYTVSHNAMQKEGGVVRLFNKVCRKHKKQK